jgi:hypothetical protein
MRSARFPVRKAPATPPVPVRDKPTAVKHPSSRRLYAYWSERRANRPAPERSDIDPAAIRALLGDSFVLSGENERRFRVAGTRIGALFGRELRGEPFASIWDGRSAALIRDAVMGVAEGAGIIAGAQAQGRAGPTIHLELLLLPLIHAQTIGGRMLGLLTAQERPYWLGMWPAAPLRLATIRYLVEPAAPALIARVRARRPRHLTVIEGGRL